VNSGLGLLAAQTTHGSKKKTPSSQVFICRQSIMQEPPHHEGLRGRNCTIPYNLSPVDFLTSWGNKIISI
jgi:hypothetical protein